MRSLYLAIMRGDEGTSTKAALRCGGSKLMLFKPFRDLPDKGEGLRVKVLLSTCGGDILKANMAH